MARCAALRKVPLANLSASDCRALLTQGVGTQYVVPMALDFVESDPLVEGDYYPGDLLTALLRPLPAELAASEALHTRLISVAKRVDELLALDPEPSGSDIRPRRDVQAALAVAER